MNHKWHSLTQGYKCLRCGLTTKTKARKSLKDPRKKVQDVLYKLKGKGELWQLAPDRKLPACTGD